MTCHQDLYDVVFKGEIMPTLAPESVAAELARLFRSDPGTIAALFDGRAHTLKSGIERALAEKYREALKEAGAIVYLKRMGAAGVKTPDKPPAPSRSDGSLSIAPAGGTLLRDDERPRPVTPSIDTSGIDLAEVDGAPLAPPRPTPPPAPDTSHIDLAEPGARLGPPAARPPPPPDTDGLALAPPGPLLRADERAAAAAPLDLDLDFTLLPTPSSP